MFSCDKCGRKFDCGFKLITHKKLHQNIFFNLSCGICGKQFANEFILNSHMFSHNVKGNKCDSCAMVFFNSDDLNYHKLNCSWLEDTYKDITLDEASHFKEIIDFKF